jgi:hypothetical protein
MTSQQHLVAWLRQQLDEDERWAKTADEGPWKVGVTSGMAYANGQWAYGSDTVRYEGGEVWPQRRKIRGSHVSGQKCLIATMEDCGLSSREANAEHIARHDPARVLREVEAKRRIIDEFVIARAKFKRVIPGNDFEAGERAARFHSMHLAVRLLALPYSGRPGYREEWKP